MRSTRYARRSFVGRLIGLLILFAPAASLAFLAARANSLGLASGAAAVALAAGLFARSPAAWRPPASGPALMLYAIALGWAWFHTAHSSDPAAANVRGGLLVAAVLLLASHDLFRSGAEPRRRAVRLCQRLTARTRWPEHVDEYRTLPEVRGLRDAAADAPGPILDLLDDPRPEVRAAAFTALEGRSAWRPTEAAAVLAAARATPEPAVRSIAVLALGASDGVVLSGVTGFLRDPSSEVRWAAGAVAVEPTGRKWPLVRDAVRAALADPKLVADGPLPGATGHLSAMAVCDLTAWAADADPLATRAARTLIAHYAHVLQTPAGPELAPELAHQLTDPATPAGLRVELATLFRSLGLLSSDLLDRMSNADQPGPIRLLAVEQLLASDPHDPDGLDVLRGLGRQPNRELALAIARVLQIYLHMDMGLHEEGLDAKSKQAGEVARRVLLWATGQADLAAVPAHAGGPAPRKVW